MLPYQHKRHDYILIFSIIFSVVLHLVVLFFTFYIAYMISIQALYISIDSHAIKKSISIRYVQPKRAQKIVNMPSDTIQSAKKAPVIKNIPVQPEIPRKLPVEQPIPKKDVAPSPKIVEKRVVQKIPIINKLTPLQAMQAAIAKTWKPPVGIAKDAACAIKIRVDQSGHITDIHVDQSSGVLLFDIAARNALVNATIPRAAWNTTLSIKFT